MMIIIWTWFLYLLESQMGREGRYIFIFKLNGPDKMLVRPLSYYVKDYPSIWSFGERKEEYLTFLPTYTHVHNSYWGRYIKIPYPLV